MKVLKVSLLAVAMLLVAVPARSDLSVRRVWQADNFAWVVVSYRNHTGQNLKRVVIECTARDAEERPVSSARKVHRTTLGPGRSFEERLLIGLDDRILDTALCSVEARRAW